MSRREHLESIAAAKSELLGPIDRIEVMLGVQFPVVTAACVAAVGLPGPDMPGWRIIESLAHAKGELLAAHTSLKTVQRELLSYEGNL